MPLGGVTVIVMVTELPAGIAVALIVVVLVVEFMVVVVPTGTEVLTTLKGCPLMFTLVTLTAEVPVFLTVIVIM
ncbi:hypothetical protein SUSAZ_10880 [Sulfolobus acidocaldarius SUSAZ]|nr:hypothetical protein SUSAZ_10880 [Sulfolobus acidocaldarius SUSAZ]